MRITRGPTLAFLLLSSFAGLAFAAPSVPDATVLMSAPMHDDFGGVAVTAERHADAVLAVANVDSQLPEIAVPDSAAAPNLFSPTSRYRQKSDAWAATDPGEGDDGEGSTLYHFKPDHPVDEGIA